MTRDVPGPVPGHPGWDRLVVGDRVVVPRSGRTGKVARVLPRGYVRVTWDEPVFGKTDGQVAVTLLERIR